MKANIENALLLCGRERVMHREGRDPNASVAIRWDPSVRNVTAADGTERFLVRSGDDLDEAGEQAARAFAARIREVARDLGEWADRIERALDTGTSLEAAKR